MFLLLIVILLNFFMFKIRGSESNSVEAVNLMNKYKTKHPIKINDLSIILRMYFMFGILKDINSIYSIFTFCWTF